MSWQLAGFMIIIFCLKIMTSSLAGERPPVSPAYFKPSVHPLSTRVSDSKVNIWSAFLPKPLKEANVNWNLLSLWDIASLRKWRWMTGTPVGPHPSGPSYCPVAHRWVGWDMKGLTRCWGCFSAFVLHESHEGFRAFPAGTEAGNIFPTALSSTEYSSTQVWVSCLILNRYLPLCVIVLDTVPPLL